MPSPLAERLRPKSFEEVVGQPHLLGREGFITRTVASGHPVSILLWGPPGSGKTSIAKLYAKAFALRFCSMSAIFSGVADIRKLVQEVEREPLFGQSVLLFVDEIHRFNKAQQDAFLPFVEKGTIVLVGATVENPSFYLNNALLSRLTVLKLNALDDAALGTLLERYESRHGKLPIEEKARRYLVELAHGDGRYLYNLIENIEKIKEPRPLTCELLQSALPERVPLYDKEEEWHYNLISALHKSLRGSDADAALYWFARMLEGGEEPLYIARRLIRVASEDVGLADPQALPLALAAHDAYQRLGSPEGELALAEVVVYLALAPKSNATYIAYNGARDSAKNSSHLAPPAHILNAPTKLMKELGYGAGYEYDHATPEGFSGQDYFPKELQRQEFYRPVARGFEREMVKRIKYFARLRAEKAKENHKERGS